MTEKRELPWWQKYTLTLNEASEYFGIGYKKLKLFVQEHSDADFVLWNGNRALIKREQFEKYMDSQMNVIQFKKVFKFLVEKELCLWYTINTQSDTYYVLYELSSKALPFLKGDDVQ